MVRLFGRILRVSGSALPVYGHRIPPGAHTVTASEPAGVIVGYDQGVSYGYTGARPRQVNEISSFGDAGDTGE